jgi:PPM family protein phosphatase
VLGRALIVLVASWPAVAAADAAPPRAAGKAVRNGIDVTAHAIRLPPAGRLYAVVDGLSGHAAEDRAQRIASAAIAARGRGVGTPRSALERASTALRRAVGRDQSLRGMGATAAALAIGRRRVHIAHVGDVRVYRIRAGTATQLTRDHALVEDFIDRERVPEAEREAYRANFPHQNIVTRALGMRDVVEPGVVSDEPARGDRYVLGTAATWRRVSPADLARLVNEHEDPGAAVQAIVGLAAAGETDDVAVVLVEWPSG